MAASVISFVVLMVIVGLTTFSNTPFVSSFAPPIMVGRRIERLYESRRSGCLYRCDGEWQRSATCMMASMDDGDFFSDDDDDDDDDNDDMPMNPGEEIFNPKAKERAKASAAASAPAMDDIPPLPSAFGGGMDDGVVADEEDEQTSIEQLVATSGPFEDHIPKLNTVTLSGRVGNPQLEPRYFDDGKVVLNLSLAVKRKYHPLERQALNLKSGEEETDWFQLEIWGRDAEYATAYIEKGSRIGITGSLVVDSWVDRATGEPRSRPKIVVKQLDILETKAEAELRRRNVQERAASGGSYNSAPSSRQQGGTTKTITHQMMRKTGVHLLLDQAVSLINSFLDLPSCIIRFYDMYLRVAASL